MNYGWLAAGALVFSNCAIAELAEGDLMGQWSTVRFLAERGGEGISEQGLALIRDIYKRAMDEMMDKAAKGIIDMCERPQRLRDGGQEALIKFLEHEDKQQQDVQLRALDRIYDNLSREDRKALDVLIEEDRKHMTVVAPGPVAFALTGELTVEQVIERSCKPEVLEQLKRQ